MALGTSLKWQWAAGHGQPVDSVGEAVQVSPGLASFLKACWRPRQTFTLL